MRGPASAERRPTLVLPTDEPAGTIATRTAGVVAFRATLSWKRSGDVPSGPTIPALPGTVRCAVVETDDPGEARREIIGEIKALTQRDLGSALEVVMRSLTIAAALTEALLETDAARLRPPGATPAKALEAMALQLWGAGFVVRFAPSWTPVPEGALAVGIGGAEAELRSLLEAHPSWEMA